MNHLQKLDAVLLTLEKYHSKGHLNHDRLLAALRVEYPGQEFFGILLAVLDKLKKDGYVRFMDKFFDNGERAYMITFEGRVFNEMEGYWKKWNDQRKESWPKRNWLLVAAITYFMGILPLILKECRKGTPSTEALVSGTTTPAGPHIYRENPSNFDEYPFGDSGWHPFFDSGKSLRIPIDTAQ